MKPKSKNIKKIVSLTPVVMRWGNKLMKERGFGDDFSEFVADLIRRQKEKADLRKKMKASHGHDGVEKRI